MMSTTAILINLLVLAGLITSLALDRGKTVRGLRTAAMAFIGILPSILVIIALIGVIMGFVPQEAIAAYLGEESGMMGILSAGLIGAVLSLLTAKTPFLGDTAAPTTL